MIDRLLFGEVSIKIEGFSVSTLIDKIRKSCKVISLYMKNDAVYLTTLGIHEKRIKELCEKSDCICEILKRRGVIYKISRYFRRFGIYFGAAAAAVLIVYLSNTVVKIDIRGTSDEALKSEIRAILSEQGLHAGAYIPSLNFLKLGSVLFEQSDKVAWASLGRSGSVVYVNVSETTDKTDSENMRIPCNIVSDRDAVIVDAKVMVGRLEVLLGDAVSKGQMLVSGVIDHTGVSTKYFHSYAHIIGRYEESAEFRQDYTVEKTIGGEKLYRRAFCFFELEIPLPGAILDKNASYSVKSQIIPVKLFGLTLPFSIKTYEYSELRTDVKRYSTAEALAEVYRRLDSYERNILADKKIVSRDITEIKTEEGVILEVKYVLEGEIGKPSEIFIK